MTRSFPVILSCIFLLLWTGCGSRKQSGNQSADSLETAATSSGTSDEVAITGHLADLGLTNDSDWRGINLGDDFTKVKATEKGEAFESDARHIGYTIEFPNLETSDVLYYQADQKVSAIDVDLFLNSRQSVDAYTKELEPYFTARYGAPKTGNGGTIWTGPGGKTVLLKDVSKGKDFGLKIKIAPSGSAITASTK
ncbi:hypothetical protein [Spirosoma koreense]